MSERTIHVIGAGLAGLSGAVHAAARGARVRVWEGAAQAGGRCRSYFDPQLEMTIDNGNHLVLSGNGAVMAYLRVIGAADRLVGPQHARIDFADLGSGIRWAITPNDGPFPWWIFDPGRRTPGASALDHLALAHLLAPPADASIGEVIAPRGIVWDRLLGPFLLAALNTKAQTGSAALAAAVVRQSLAKGGLACCARIAHPNLSAAFVDPALAFLRARGAAIHFGARVIGLKYAGRRVSGFRTRTDEVEFGPEDGVILAVPAQAAPDLAPGVQAPTSFRAIVNAHFKFAAPAHLPWMIGVIGGVAEWIFAFEDRLSVTISAADEFLETDREDLARRLWADVAAVHDLPAALPPWQIVKERRATFAATPDQARLRPPARTRWSNLWLAGDWTATGLPATIEGALRSGRRAGRLALAATAR